MGCQIHRAVQLYDHSGSPQAAATSLGWGVVTVDAEYMYFRHLAIRLPSVAVFFPPHADPIPLALLLHLPLLTRVSLSVVRTSSSTSASDSSSRW